MSDVEKKKSGGGLWKALSLVLVLIVVGGGAGAGGVGWSPRSAGTVAGAEPAAAPVPVAVPQPTGLVTLEPFLVNLADADAGRFLRTSMQLVVADAATAATLTKQDVVLMRVRSAILEVLTEQSAAALVTPAGKTALKQLIQERATQVGGVAVADVLFADFVVQF
ncbi:MAG: flagellar basal body-associated FliL family protein [Vicinamibacterales bacterium]|nr:flagellar basal body-associated FliL family protein [Vicinamibacterales bacterium]